ncbi:hypothetical protein PENTCL1PPCAC_16964, partial [Pristionchus entomophagus]
SFSSMVFLILALLGWSIHDIIYYMGVFTLLSKAWPLLPVLRKKIFGKQPKRLNEENAEKDLVYLFQKRCTFTSRGSNWQLPFVELNGETISDSQIIIRRLTEKMQLQPYPDAQSAAMGHAVDRMLDNHTFNLNVHAKLDKLGALIESLAKNNNIPAFVVPIVAFLGAKIMRSKLEKRVKTSIGIFTEEQYKELLRNDLLQLQTILGQKKFLMGDQPYAVDCTALGQLGVAYYAVPSARTCVHDLLDSDEFASLKEYLVRTKETIYGDKFFDVEAR